MYHTKRYSIVSELFSFCYYRKSQKYKIFSFPYISRSAFCVLHSKYNKNILPSLRNEEWAYACLVKSTGGISGRLKSTKLQEIRGISVCGHALFYPFFFVSKNRISFSANISLLWDCMELYFRFLADVVICVDSLIMLLNLLSHRCWISCTSSSQF